MKDIVKASAIQMICEVGDVEANYKKAGEFCKKATEQGAELICLPEIFDYGYDLSYFKKNPPKEPLRTSEFLTKLSSEIGSCIVAGTLEVDGSVYYNSTLVVTPNDGEVAKYRKVHLFSTDPIHEDEFFQKGDHRTKVSLPIAEVGVITCYDLRFPELTRALCFDGAEIICVPAAFPFPRIDAWRILNRARALENQLFVVAANQVGQREGAHFLGHSLIISPDGNVLSEAHDKEEKILIADLEKRKMLDYRKRIPALTHCVPKVYGS